MNVGGLDYVIMAKTSLSARIVAGADFVRMGKKNVILAVLVFGSIIRGSPSTDNHYTNEKWCSSQTNSVSHYLQSFPRIPIDKRVIARPRLKISYYCLSPLSQTLRACNLLISNSPHQKEHLGPVQIYTFDSPPAHHLLQFPLTLSRLLATYYNGSALRSLTQQCRF